MGEFRNVLHTLLRHADTSEEYVKQATKALKKARRYQAEVNENLGWLIDRTQEHEEKGVSDEQ